MRNFTCSIFERSFIFELKCNIYQTEQLKSRYGCTRKEFYYIYELFAKDFFYIMISLFCYYFAKNESSE